MTRRDLSLMLGYQCVWLVTALSARTPLSWAGPLAALALIGAATATSSNRRASICLVVVAALLGVSVETALLRSDVLDYGSAARDLGIAPPWIVLLWASFAATIGPVSRMLPGRALLPAAVLGAVLAPCAYLAGARMGALAFVTPNSTGPAAIALAWGLAMPALIALHRRLGAA